VGYLLIQNIKNSYPTPVDPTQFGGVYLDAADITPYVHNQGVASWTNRCGGGSNAVAIAGMNSPNLNLTALNGNPYIFFNLKTAEVPYL
jgi:hypothetical protein